MNQKTLQQSCVLRGIGVHSGCKAQLIIEAAAVDHGIVWVHEQTQEHFAMGQVVPVVAPHATVLATERARISTVEHVMAALWQQGITNAVCRLQGDEAPICDGSSSAIIWALQAAGVVDQGVPAQMLTPKETLSFVDEVRGGRIVIHAAGDADDGLTITYRGVGPRLRGDDNKNEASFQESHSRGNGYDSRDEAYSQECHYRAGGLSSAHATEGLSKKFFVGEPKKNGNPEGAGDGGNLVCTSPEQFACDFAPARTCGDVEQLEALRAHGLARGSCLGNTIARAAGEYVNTPRFEDEPRRHKVLDLIGDLYLLGRPLIGHVEATNTGHSFNRQVVAHYVQYPEQWRLVTKDAHDVAVRQHQDQRKEHQP